jgi:hypothetical protein
VSLHELEARSPCRGAIPLSATSAAAASPHVLGCWRCASLLPQPSPLLRGGVLAAAPPRLSFPAGCSGPALLSSLLAPGSGSALMRPLPSACAHQLAAVEGSVAGPAPPAQLPSARRPPAAAAHSTPTAAATQLFKSGPAASPPAAAAAAAAAAPAAAAATAAPGNALFRVVAARPLPPPPLLLLLLLLLLVLLLG